MGGKRGKSVFVDKQKVRQKVRQEKSYNIDTELN